MTDLTPHFRLEEFLRSETAIRAGREVEADTLTIANLRRLCNLVLEPLRDAVGPIRILSGFRPVWLNQMVGGSATSEHVPGRAADIEVVGMANDRLCQKIIDLNLPFNQVILEFGLSGWVHVSVPRLGDIPKGEVMTAAKVGGRTMYSAGLVVGRPSGHAA